MQEKVLFHCQSSFFSFLHFICVQTKVNDAYDLIVALLSCLSGIESVMEKAPEASSTASCCGERSDFLFSPFTLCRGKQRDLVGRHWEGSRRGQRHWLWMGTGGFCMASIAKGGRLFSFFPFVQACLPYSLPTNYYYYHLFSDIALSSYIPVMSYVRASSLPCVVCVCGAQFWELGFYRLFPHSTSYPTGTLPGEGGSYPASYSLCKTDVETGFWPLYLPCPKQKLILLWREKKNWKPWTSLFEQLVRKKMVMGCLLPPQCQVVFMAEYMTNKATLSLSMRQYKKAMQMSWLSTQDNL